MDRCCHCRHPVAGYTTITYYRDDGRRDYALCHTCGLPIVTMQEKREAEKVKEEASDDA